jgi:hypothetical protein
MLLKILQIICVLLLSCLIVYLTSLAAEFYVSRYVPTL